jgi:hypothetical protein
MTVLLPSPETEVDAFDLDLRVVPAESGQDAGEALASPGDVSYYCSTGPLAGC